MKNWFYLIFIALNIASATESFEINQINLSVNEAITYTSDVPGEDLWQNPLQTMELKTGDCEDIAILKYYYLKKILPENAKLRLAYSVLLTDNVRTPHMVLLIKNSSDEFKILDNTTSLVFDANQRSDIEIIVSFDEKSEYRGYSNLLIEDTQLTNKLNNVLNHVH